MNNFLLIAQYILESTGDSTRDVFKTACQVYEDEYGDITDAEAEVFHTAFLEMLDTKETA